MGTCYWLSICIFTCFTFIHTSPIRSSSFRPLHRKLFWLLVADCLLFGWIGCQPVEDPYVLIGQIASVYFFIYFLIAYAFIRKTRTLFDYTKYVNKHRVGNNKSPHTKIIQSNICLHLLNLFGVNKNAEVKNGEKNPRFHSRTPSKKRCMPSCLHIKAPKKPNSAVRKLRKLN